MTINTQKLREAAQRVIKAFDADWYAPGDWQETNDPLPYCDAHHIAAASPTVVIGLLDALDAQTAEIARLRDALEESKSLFAAMCHEVRPLKEIRAQMIENRAALSGESKC